jgi:hypothetical protein
MTVASLQILTDAQHGSAPRFPFLAVAFPQSGVMIDRAFDVEQDLTSTGINYQRWLRMFAQFPSVQAESIIDTDDFISAIALSRLHHSCASRFADLTITYATRTYIYRKVKIRSVLAIPRQGSVTGSGTTGTPTASVRTSWQWQCTEAAQ